MYLSAGLKCHIDGVRHDAILRANRASSLQKLIQNIHNRRSDMRSGQRSGQKQVSKKLTWTSYHGRSDRTNDGIIRGNSHHSQIKRQRCIYAYSNDYKNIG